MASPQKPFGLWRQIFYRPKGFIVLAHRNKEVLGQAKL
jgi:hypothetical protein